MRRTLDYPLNRLFYDLHTDSARALEYRKSRTAVLDQYALPARIREAVETNDVATLARFTNPFLLRYYFFLIGMSEKDFIDKLQPLRQGSVTESLNG